MRDHEARSFRRRARLLLAGLWIGLAVVAIRAGQLQLQRHDFLKRLSEEQYQKEVRVPPRRGDMLDRDGHPLAVSVDVPSVHANPMMVQDARATARALAPVLGVKKDILYDRLASERQFVWLKRHITPDVAERVTALHLPGIAITKEPKRFYPNREIGAHVLGFTGIDSEGLEGLEKSLEEQLRGETQWVPAIRDGRGKKVLAGELDPEERARGANVRLTLDLQIQHAAQAALQKAVVQTHAEFGMVVAMDVATAEILAMAVEPQFNPNFAAAVPSGQRRNRTVTDIFEPGSTLKPLVVAAALEAKAINPDQQIFCENGSMAIGRRRISDVKPQGWLTLTQIIAKSSNIGMAKIGMALGRHGLGQAIHAYGFGQRTGIDYPGEVPGIVRPAAKWSDIGLANVSFGHGLAVTAVQLASAYRVLASGGNFRTPRLVRWFERPDGSIVQPATPVAQGFVEEAVGHLQQAPRQEGDAAQQERRVLTRKITRRVNEMMEAVIGPDGTGRRAQVPGYRVAGKTGTAQKVDAEGGYSHDRYAAIFAGFLPAQAPEVVLVVVVDEPKGDHTGGLIAAPIFSEIARVAMHERGVLPTEPMEDAGQGDGAVIKGPDKKGDGGAEHDARTQSGPLADGMPSFIGMTAQQAVARFTESKLSVELVLQGTGRVARQRLQKEGGQGQHHTLLLVLEP